MSENHFGKEAFAFFSFGRRMGWKFDGMLVEIFQMAK